MTSLDKIAAKNQLKRNNVNSIGVLDGELKVIRKNIQDYKGLLDGCPKLGGKNCRESRQSSIDSNYKRLAEKMNLKNTLIERNKVLDSELAVLNSQAEQDVKNSATLAQQGLTAQSVEIKADKEAQTQAEIARKTSDQNLTQSKQRNYIYIIALVLVIIGAVLFFKKRFKK
tara:strand:- start:516 stop:1028 length:513 start_codon:yes stop_codon:yes gene_type:complete